MNRYVRKMELAKTLVDLNRQVSRFGHWTGSAASASVAVNVKQICSYIIRIYREIYVSPRQGSGTFLAERAMKVKYF